MLSLSASAQPPALIHYQGRLTDSLGTPVIGAQTIYFSLWSGGTAAAAGSGTQLYREHATIQPTSNGVIEHDVGGGTVDAGSIKASDFGTANPIFLQVEAGGAALLPRTPITSVGYAFYAAQAGYAPQTGTPRVATVTDKTGGDTVIGDLLQVTGAGLDGTTVTVGGRPAPIVGTRTATSLTCQVPAGIPMGLNPVAIIDQANSLNSVTVAHVNVHRLIVWVSRNTNSGLPQIIIVDALTGAKKAELYVPWVLGQDAAIPRLQMAFANQGSLALVPSNGTDGQVHAINLTANPPALVQTNGFYVGASRAVAAAVSADNLLAVSDFGGNRLKFVKINESAPPYSTGLLTILSNQILDLNYATGFGYPRGLAFVGGLLMVCEANPAVGADCLYAFRRVTGTNNFQFVRPIDASVDLNNTVEIGNQPFAIQPTRDQCQLLVISLDLNNAISLLRTGPEGFSAVQGALGVGKVCGVGIAPEGNSFFAADALAVGRSSRIAAYNIANGYTELSEMEDTYLPRNNYNALQLVGMEPVEGRQIAVGTNTDTLLLFERAGGVLSLQRRIQINGTTRDTYELQYQP